LTKKELFRPVRKGLIFLGTNSKRGTKKISRKPFGNYWCLTGLSVFTLVSPLRVLHKAISLQGGWLQGDKLHRGLFYSFTRTFQDNRIKFNPRKKIRGLVLGRLTIQGAKKFRARRIRPWLIPFG